MVRKRLNIFNYCLQITENLSKALKIVVIPMPISKYWIQKEDDTKAMHQNRASFKKKQSTQNNKVDFYRINITAVINIWLK